MALMPYVRPKYLDDNSVLAVGYKLFFYAAGTTTKQNTYTDATLGVANPNPIILNARGEPDNAGTPVDVYLTPGVSYKVVLATDTDIDPPNNPVWTVDNVVGDGGGGGGGGGSGQWEGGLNATYLDDNTFLLVGVDLTIDFHQGRRVWLSGGQSRFGVISVSSYGVDTSVTLVDIQDATGSTGVIDPALTTASPSIQRVDGNKGLHYRFYPGADTGVTNFEFPLGDLRRYGAKMDDVDDNAAFVACVGAIVSGGALFVPDGVAVVQPITVSKTIRFIGTGTLKLQGSANADFLTFGAGSDSSSIRGLHIDANRAAQTTEGAGIVVNSSDMAVENCHVRNASDGIMIATAAANNITIRGNHFSNCSLSNINAQQDAIAVSITKNSVNGANYGIRVLQASNVTVSGNTILDFILIGVDVSMVTTAADGVKITDNLISNKDVVSTGDGISIKSSNNTIISHNILDKIKNDAIVVDRLSGTDPACIGYDVNHNTIIEAVESGIKIGVADIGLVVDNVLVTNNITNYGIYLIGNGGSGGADQIVVAHNTVGQCVIDEFFATGAGSPRVLGENALFSGAVRHGNIVFENDLTGIIGGNWSQIGGFSSSNIEARNFAGQSVWSGTSSFADPTIFAQPEPNTSYGIIVATDGSAGGYQLSNPTVNGFTLQLSGAVAGFPGKTVSWFLYRYA